MSGRELSVWLYNCFPKEGYDNAGTNGFPGFFASRVRPAIEAVAGPGASRASFTAAGGKDVENYIGFKLMYDVNQDVDKLLDEYFSGLYGAAAAR